MKKLLLSTFLTIPLHGALTAGDVVLLGISADGTTFGSTSADQAAWVPLVDLAAGETLYFTDSNYESTTNTFSASSNSDDLWSFTTPTGGISAGTIQFFADSSAVAQPNYAHLAPSAGGGGGSNQFSPSATAGGMSDLSFSTLGDQLLVFSSTMNPALSGFDVSTHLTSLHAINYSDTGWSNAIDSTSANLSDLYPGLTDGLTAVNVGTDAFGSEPDNTIYTGPTTGTKAQILTAMSNLANWNSNISDGFDYQDEFSGTSFTVIPEPSGSTLLAGASLFLIGRRKNRK